ncbi:MAG TPA: flagellar biosynthesis anti-sigma factor FlgM [Bryobacteraceae bacterium]|jgi:anti-sigma28 factor (negative regulator of flagellin synthesis)
MGNDAKSTAGGSSAAAAPVLAKATPVPEGNTPDDDRIAELRRRYLEGSYKVDAEQLSAKIIDKHLER